MGLPDALRLTVLATDSMRAPVATSPLGRCSDSTGDLSLYGAAPL
jgi:hypothetical protein